MVTKRRELDEEHPLAARLEVAIRLLALQMTQGMKTVEKIRFLSRAGMDRVAIAEIAETTPDTVSVRISEFKREKRNRQAPETAARVEPASV